MGGLRRVLGCARPSSPSRAALPPVEPSITSVMIQVLAPPLEIQAVELLLGSAGTTPDKTLPSAPRMTLCTRSPVVAQAETAAGKSGLTMLPLGSSSSSGRMAPALLGM